MIRKLVYLSLFLVALLVSACGVVVQPAWEATPTQIAAQSTQSDLISIGGEGSTRPTLPPTATLVPPTATPEPPTLAPTLAPTEAPTVAVEPTTDSAAAGSEDGFTVLVSLYDAAEGQELFNRTEPTNGYACSSCHRVDSDDTLIGPGLLTIATRGATRVEGESAATYIYNSIIDPRSFLVPGFPEQLMPANWHEVYTDDQIYAIVNYLLTLSS